MENIFALLVTLLVATIFGAIVFYLIKRYSPEPWRHILLWVFAALCVVYVIGLFLGHFPVFPIGDGRSRAPMLR